MARDSQILIVDDEDVVRETIKRILEDEGFDVFIAGNGITAVGIVEDYNIDIALLDIKLPDMNGVEVLERIKLIKPKIKIVMITAYEMEELVKKAFVAGAYACLHKPFEIQALLKILKELKGKI